MEAVIYLIIFVIGLVSYEGFRNADFRQKYVFNVDKILVLKEYYRIFSSGFLHANWMHLIFNVVALSSFGAHIIFQHGLQNFALIYLTSLVGGGLLSLYVHRHHGSYTALGASGAISGVMFSSIFTSPFSEISFMFIPVGFPAWLMGLIFVAVSIWGIKKATGSIGHEAHLGGAVSGMIVTALVNLTLLVDNFWIFSLLMIPSLGFILYLVKHPAYLIVNKAVNKAPKRRYKNLKVTYNRTEENKETRLNELLDKINSKGYESLSKTEKRQLHELSGGQ